jgi:DNA-binding LytR/AlgR family response regulator
VSRSELVNVDHVTRFEPISDGSAELTLSDRTLVRVSRRRAPQVRRVLEA